VYCHRESLRETTHSILLQHYFFETLQNLNLNYLNLSWANLTEADLTGASFKETNLDNANLTNAIGFRTEEHDYTMHLNNTVLPNGSTWD
jgi:uncharacterized protein YjbI with pentapeptide repeats